VVNHPLPAPEPIVVIDAFLHPETFPKVISELGRLHHWQPEIDFRGAAPVGETCELPSSFETYRAIIQELKKLFPCRGRSIASTSTASNRGGPQFHADGDVITCLLYADPGNWSPHDHGERNADRRRDTRILPLPNRMLVFDGRILHRATSFQTRVRHTIAAN
jgi:hypothetical protein